MKNILARLTANNQVVIRYVDRPNCYAPASPGDSNAQKESTFIACMQKRVEQVYTRIRQASDRYVHDNSANFNVKLDQTLHFGGCGSRGEIFSMERYKGEACTIPESVRYTQINNNVPTVVEKSIADLLEERQQSLDIISKSQQRPKKPRPWGLPQTVKKFTLNAKQKILEAGSVVDMHTMPDSRYMLTLTIPGSGIDVYDCVARYSGYMVNRLAQIIRRLESKGVRVHWFFVWEHQKRGALHMHWCIAVDNSPAMCRRLCEQLRLKWFELLEELTVKTGIDLFRKRGLAGTWRNSPEVWQADIQPIEKSVAAYFSKYVSKSVETSRFNRYRRDRQEELRKKYPDRIEYARVISLCPSRYWGCSRSVKILCKQYRVTVEFKVTSRQDATLIAQYLTNWLFHAAGELKSVCRDFKIIDDRTKYEYCKGWEVKSWFDNSKMSKALTLFKRLYSNQERKTDGVGAVLSLDDF